MTHRILGGTWHQQSALQACLGRRPRAELRHGRERGAGTALILTVMIVLCMVTAVSAWFAGWLASGSRARSAADVVAIAAAQAQHDGRPACQVAEEAASNNHARLTSCDVTTGWGEFIVNITVEVEMRPQVPGGPHSIEARSRAGIVSDPG